MHRSLTLGLTLILLTPAVVLGEFTLVVAPGSDEALPSTIQTHVDQAAAVGGRAILKEYNPATNEIYLLLQFSEEAPASPLRSRGIPFHPNGTRVSVLVEALDATTEPNVNVGMPVVVDLSLRELYELRTHPAGQRQTVLGSMLRNRWKKALAGRPDDDRVRPRFTPMIRFQALNGDDGPMVATQPFFSSDLDDLLGRTRRLEERIKARQEGRSLYPLRSISDRLDRRVEAALVQARLHHRDDPAVWNHLNTLRSGAPRRFTKDDHEFLDALVDPPTQTTPTPTQTTQTKRAGARGGLEQLGND